MCTKLLLIIITFFHCIPFVVCHYFVDQSINLKSFDCMFLVCFSSYFGLNSKSRQLNCNILSKFLLSQKAFLKMHKDHYDYKGHSTIMFHWRNFVFKVKNVNKKEVLIGCCIVVCLIILMTIIYCTNIMFY